VRTKYINATMIIQKLFGFGELTGFILYMHNYIILIKETLNSPFYTSCYITPNVEHIIVAHVEVYIASLHSCSRKCVVPVVCVKLGNGM